MRIFPRRLLFTGGLGLLGAAGVTACAEAEPTGQSQTGTDPQSGEDSGTLDAGGHVHGIVRDPSDGVVLLATHYGLFRIENGALTPVGPTVDLMGFTLAPQGHYLASGHPGSGVDLPEPMGLIESTDKGQTWSLLSRGGESDFHALTAGAGRVLGFDGELRSSTDGHNWETLSIPAPPAALSTAPGSGTIAAATEAGLLVSADGASWETLQTPSLISRVAWADETSIVGAGTDGRLLTSRDAGQTWTASEDPVGEVVALGAGLTEEGAVEALFVADSTVLRTTDGGNTVEQLV
ncbi:F510_1955 family glycosylhydrolase [Nesterenkonia sp. Act20]|uniref:F510_1955 family glycosylhydrolase n=1 Tax=Nesterenkonia sp. Act20 TaxID=1483432 RepID=UPI001C48D102|nr:hypothetical protein [Nesterenkonia sp. Act20]